MTESAASGTLPRVRTRGLNHINLVVSDVATAVRFYQDALGLEMRNTGTAQGLEVTFLTTPGAGDLLALQAPIEQLDRSRRAPRTPGRAGGMDHFGFAVADPASLDALLEQVTDAGGRVHAQFVDPSGAHIAFISDLDGYLVQLTAGEEGAEPT